MTTLTDVYNDLLANGGFKTTTGFIQSAQGVTANNDGSYTVKDTVIAASTAAQFGAVPSSNTATFPPNTVVYTALGQTFYEQIIGISADGSQILFKGLTSSGAAKFLSFQVLNAATVPDSSATSFFPSTTANITLPCFAAGTRIAIAEGRTVVVEDLQVGDMVLTVSGERREIVWTGSRVVDIARHSQPENVRPVVISAHAFAENQPVRDLVVSPDHNVFFEGVLIPAKCLVDGHAVTVSDRSSVAYHHIELAEHDVVFAENLAVETYLDTGNRSSFVNADVVAAEADFGTVDLNYFAWEARGCARLVVAGPELDRARSLLASRRQDAPVPERAVA